ncbi:MAG TPA: FKBP-type peptidyl-prolyl cis-trans isomerase [Bacteroidales bacterium]
MKIDKNKVVTMTYVLRLNDESGDVIQEVDKKRPFVQLFGAGTLLPTFELNLQGLEAGDDFGFALTADEAYGNPTDEAIIELEKSIFEIDGIFDADLVEIGKVITMQDQNGHPMDGKVLAIKDETVVMDFNHPLAGENLYFSGEIIDVRNASKEELSHGHVHGNGGHHH